MKKYLATACERRKHKVRLRIRMQQKPRLSIFRSGRYIYAQVIDDAQHITIASASSLEKREEKDFSCKNKEAAAWLGTEIAKRCLEKGVKEVVFDRGPYAYHGRLKILAESARSSGLLF